MLLFAFAATNCLREAHVAAVTDVEQVKAVMAILLENNKIRNATHNIMAYRIAAPGRPGVFYQDCDDDGEAAAGGRLLHLLQVGVGTGIQASGSGQCMLTNDKSLMQLATSNATIITVAVVSRVACCCT